MALFNKKKRDDYERDDMDSEEDIDRAEGVGHYSDNEFEYENRPNQLGAKSRNKTPKSAKTFDEKNLRNMKLTTKDY